MSSLQRQLQRRLYFGNDNVVFTLICGLCLGTEGGVLGWGQYGPTPRVDQVLSHFQRCGTAQRFRPQSGQGLLLITFINCYW